MLSSQSTASSRASSPRKPPSSAAARALRLDPAANEAALTEGFAAVASLRDYAARLPEDDRRHLSHVTCNRLLGMNQPAKVQGALDRLVSAAERLTRKQRALLVQQLFNDFFNSLKHEVH